MWQMIDSGDRCSFLVLFSRRLGIIIFPFPLTPAQYGNFCTYDLYGPVRNDFDAGSILTVHYFNSYVPIALQAGQATVLGRLSLSMCLWLLYLSTAL